MKKLLSLIFTISLTLSACGTAATQIASPAQTSTPTLAPTETQTPNPPTATITPLPTIPTFTPTFDISTIVTVTPAEKANCPITSEIFSKNSLFSENGEPYKKEYINSIVDSLNLGASIEFISTELKKTNKWGISYGIIRKEDINNDKTSELFISIQDAQFILICQGGSYIIILSREDILRGTKITTSDINQNALREINLTTYPCADAFCKEMYVYEWGGNSLVQLLHNTDDMNTIIDINNDGLSDIIGYTYPRNDSSLPTEREAMKIYSWNGTNFTEKILFSDPKYRFQSIQDADEAVLHQEYQKAFHLYQRTIFDNSLLPWSEDFYKSVTSSESEINLPIPAEYPSLAAYAYYRIILLHLAQGQEAEAASTYQTLQETFGTDPYAAPYIEMATAFWESYQSTQRMYDGCAAAIQYAVEHPEILIPLGSDYHGTQSHIYEPADVCPFR